MCPHHNRRAAKAMNPSTQLPLPEIVAILTKRVNALQAKYETAVAKEIGYVSNALEAAESDLWEAKLRMSKQVTA